MASRLSEDANITVAVLEAGPEETKFPAVDIPLATGSLWGGDHIWKYYSIPQKKSCQGMVDKKCRLIAGKLLGGSSSINMQVYQRGHRYGSYIINEYGIHEEAVTSRVGFQYPSYFGMFQLNFFIVLIWCRIR